MSLLRRINNAKQPETKRNVQVERRQQDNHRCTACGSTQNTLFTSLGSPLPLCADCNAKHYYPTKD